MKTGTDDGWLEGFNFATSHDREQAVCLLQNLQRASSEQGQFRPPLIVVTGLAGVGKSKLVHRALEKAGAMQVAYASPVTRAEWARLAATDPRAVVMEEWWRFRAGRKEKQEQLQMLAEFLTEGTWMAAPNQRLRVSVPLRCVTIIITHEWWLPKFTAPHVVIHLLPREGVL